MKNLEVGLEGKSVIYTGKSTIKYLVLKELVNFPQTLLVVTENDNLTVINLDFKVQVCDEPKVEQIETLFNSLMEKCPDKQNINMLIDLNTFRTRVSEKDIEYFSDKIKNAFKEMYSKKYWDENGNPLPRTPFLNVDKVKYSNMPSIIGLCGFIGSGKDTVADFIQEKYSRYKDAFFADNLKKAICPMFGWEYEDMKGLTEESREWRETPDPYWSEKFGYAFTPRMCMQKLGPIMRKHFGSSFWVYSLERSLSEYSLLTDVRYPEEIDLVRRKGGIIIQVDRGLKPHWFDKAVEYNECVKYGRDLNFADFNRDSMKKYLDEVSHESEYSWAGINKPDYIIENNGTLQQLKDRVYDILNTIVEKGSTVEEEKSNSRRN